MKIVKRIYLSVFLTLILCYFHTMYTGDIIAKVFGYFFTIWVIPFLLYILLISIINIFSFKKIFEIKHWKIHLLLGFILLYIPIIVLAILAMLSGEM